MCGICGVAQIGGEPRRVVADGVLERMTEVIRHRGPDDSGYHVDPGIALGARRLSIVDVAGGHQPFPGANPVVWGAQNGEIYNHAALRAQLEADGHTFRSRCDTEVIPHAYERYGTSFVERLTGIFALAVWDGDRRRLVLARDRLGVKPLYYAQVGDLLVFGSELKCLLASGLVPVDLDYEGIEAYLTLGYIPAPLTPLKGVHKLLPGHRLVVSDGEVRIERYWTFPTFEAGDRRPVDDWTEGLLEVLEQSVRDRLMSDVPLGAMLSGGLDSSLIVGLMARNTSRPVDTFSIGFLEDREGNELADAREVARFFGAEHHELELSFADSAVALDELVWHLDEPVADLSALGFLALSELAARHVTVALSGQGADELLGGYRKHRAARALGFLGAVPPPVSRLLAGAVPGSREGLGRLVRSLAAADPARRHLAMSGLLDSELRRGLVRAPLTDGSDAALRLIGRLLPGLPREVLASTLQLDAQLALPDDMLHYFDRTSMAHSLEVRVPFLDHRVVEYCATIPSRLKVRGQTTKYVLKRAASGIVPARIVDKRKLGFFRTASSEWLRTQVAGALGDHLLAGDLRVGEFLDPDGVRALARAHVEGAPIAPSQLLLAILMLEAWLTSYVDRARAAAVPPVLTGAR